ncbi:hypothetical protein [Xylella fastidiosa]|uniref:hypothetical protein n=1 Tax=Xylella fastidiosa TaxID=2371 RepID=UPI00111D4927|nr:hypothetical protein [Xylella fastidiosa]TNW18209.1 hypothetical protein EIP73_12575 [Xylella fastidiosa subsp. pauca]
MTTYTVEIRLCNGVLLAERDSQTSTDICQIVSSITALAPHAIDDGVVPDAVDRPLWVYLAEKHGRDKLSAVNAAVNALHILYDYLGLKPAERKAYASLKTLRMMH